jgi:hypothetical protein
MRVLGSLQKLLWLAYAAHGRAYGPESAQSVTLSGRGAGERTDELLDDLLRAACRAKAALGRANSDVYVDGWNTVYQTRAANISRITPAGASCK